VNTRQSPPFAATRRLNSTDSPGLFESGQDGTWHKSELTQDQAATRASDLDFHRFHFRGLWLLNVLSFFRVKKTLGAGAREERIVVIGTIFPNLDWKSLLWSIDMHRDNGHLAI
jgi:hypothetical protein